MEKLLKIQTELKAPKNNFNSFGKYNYRSCEDILESLKPLLLKHKCILSLSDDIVMMGNRYYIKANACITDIDTKESLTVSAYARESEVKKGMDESQITGSCSSYSRKYALNGLFCIDDNQDADTQNNSFNDNVQKDKTSSLNTSNFANSEVLINKFATDIKALACTKKLDEKIKAYFDKLDYNSTSYTKEMFDRDYERLSKMQDIF